MALEGTARRRPCPPPLAPRWRSFSHDSKYLAIAGEEPAIDVENVESGERLGRLQLRVASDDVSWNPKHYMLAYCGDHGWDAATGAEAGNIEFRYRPTPRSAA